MEVPAGIAAQAALTRQAISLEMVKQAANMEQQLASILEQAISNVPVSSSRGATLNMQA